MSQKEYILLLGMVFSDQFNPSQGQEFRDRVRCEALENLGFHIRTLDNKHVLLDHGKHCQSDFCNSLRMLKDIRSVWGSDIKFRHIILNYFFSPVGWARERWKDSFFTKTIPIIAQNLLTSGGLLWLPHLDNVAVSINLSRNLIEQFFIVHEIVDPLKNPLYVASENCEEDLLLCPDKIINANQYPKLLGGFPFYALELNRNVHQVIMEVADNIDDLAAYDDEDAQETLLMWESISATPTLRDTIVFRVFSGAIDSTQAGPFKTAMQAYNRSMLSSSNRKTIIVEEIDTKKLCSLKWQPHQFCNYLLHSHCYYILAHPYQSLLLHQLMWYMPEALAEYNRLKYHNGFPSGEQLRCPVFTQDKIEYIKRLGDLALPTLTVPLVEEGTSYTDACLAEVQRFMVENEENNCGWDIKAPFTTNCESVRFPLTFDEMQKFMRSSSRKYVGHLPYLMIQPCMFNRKEVKIVVLNNQPMYRAGISTGRGAKSKTGINKAFFSTSDDELLAFASEALAKFRETAPYAITDGLFHVDIFQTIAGQMVVNEFESPDARYVSVSKNSLGVDYQSLTCAFLQAYWEKKIEGCVQAIIN